MLKNIAPSWLTTMRALRFIDYYYDLIRAQKRLDNARENKK